MICKKTGIFTALSLSLISLYSCSSNEIADSKDVAQNKIYQQYSLNYTEGEKNFKIKAQFRFGGRNGTTLVLSKPANVHFDYVNMGVDSGKYAGAYYEDNRDAGLLFASHAIVYTDINKKALENNFFFNQFKLSDIPATASKKTPLSIGYSFDPYYQLQNGDYIELRAANTDSSFRITVNSTDTGKIIVPVKELKRQKGNELSLEATLYRNMKLKQVTDEGGALEITYALKPVRIKLTE